MRLIRMCLSLITSVTGSGVILALARSNFMAVRTFGCRYSACSRGLTPRKFTASCAESSQPVLFLWLSTPMLWLAVGGHGLALSKKHYGLPHRAAEPFSSLPPSLPSSPSLSLPVFVLSRLPCAPCLFSPHACIIHLEMYHVPGRYHVPGTCFYTL